MQKKIAFIVFEDFAMWQVALLQKFLITSGFKIDVLSLGGGLVRTDGGMLIFSEKLAGKEPDSYSLVLLPGAGAAIPESLIGHQEINGFLQNYHGLIAASCASSLVVAAAGKLSCEFTTMPHLKERFAGFYENGIYCDCDVVTGENLITSRGYAHYEFMLAVLGKLGLLKENPNLRRVASKLSKNE